MQSNRLQFISGFMIIFLILWGRLFKEQKPQIFKDLLYDKTLFIISILFTIFFASLLIIEIIRIIKPLSTSNRLSKILNQSKIILIISKYVTKSPIYVYERVTRNISLRWLVEKPASYFTTYFEYPRLFVIIFYFMPQILVATTFLFETILLDQRVYFIKVLNLLLLFLISKIIIFVFKNYSERRLQNFEQFLDIKKDDAGIQFALRPPEYMPPDIPMSQIISRYNYMCQFWFVYFLIHQYMITINDYNLQYSFYVRIYCFSCYFLAWFYLFLLLFYYL
jgi:hypothetical protein